MKVSVIFPFFLFLGLSFHSAIASNILFMEDFEGAEAGKKFLYDPAIGDRQDPQSLFPEIGRAILSVGNNGEISKGLGGSEKGFRYFDGELENAGALRIIGIASDKFYVSDMGENERLRVAFDVRFDGIFAKTLFEFRVMGRDTDQNGIVMALLYVIPDGTLNVTNSSERYNAMLAISQKLFSHPPDDAIGVEYHFELFFDLKKGTYDLSVYAGEDRKTPFICEVELNFSVKKDVDSPPDLFSLGEQILDVASSNFGSEGSIVVDHLLVEIVEVPR